MELLAPAGGKQSLIAAVASGADAVYFGAPKFNARSFADNFPNIPYAVNLCHENSVRAYLTLNTLVLDREMADWLKTAQTATESGIDAFIVQDIGGAMLLKKHFPEVPLHASTQMTAHNVCGVNTLYSLGCSRVILSRELTKEQIAHIAENTKAELEVFVHGALCVSYSGQCLLSSALGKRSANRGQCAQPCRLKYAANGKTGHLLSTKDLCLIDELAALESLGIKCVKIEGRMKGAAYTRAVTSVYKKALSGNQITDEDRQALKIAFCRGGFTKGRFSSSKDILYPKTPAHIGLSIGTPSKVTGSTAIIKTNVRLYPGDEIMSGAGAGKTVKIKSITPLEKGVIKLSLDGAIKRGQPLCITASPAREKACGGTSVKMPPHVEQNAATPPPYNIQKQKRTVRPKLAAEVQTKKQALSVLDYISYLYVPAKKEFHDIINLAHKKDVEVIGVFPTVLSDTELPAVKAHTQVFDSVLCGSFICPPSGGAVADASFNVMNSASLDVLSKLGFSRITMSSELNARQIEDIYVPEDVQTEAICYGHLTLMTTEHCPISCDRKTCQAKNGGAVITDRKNMHFPILKAGEGCRVKILNPLPLFMADKLSDIKADVLRLIFTTESPRLCETIAQAYGRALSGEKVSPPAHFTRSHYYKGV